MQLTNKFGLPLPFANLIKTLVYDPRESDPKRISVTTLINNPLPRMLSVAHWDELEEDVADHIWRVLGSSVHAVLDKVEKSTDNLLVEQKIEEKIGDFTIVGKLDLYDGSTKSVEDWKVTSVWSVQFGDHDDWERQLNPYAWLLRKAGFEVHELKINAILKDWRKGEFQKYADYPIVPFKVIPVKLWTFEQQEQYVKDRVAIYEHALKTPVQELPVCSATERWRKPDTFAVYKNSNKTASRVLESAAEADKWIAENGNGKDKYRVEKREGIDLRCTEYCLPCKYCRYYKMFYGDKKNESQKS